MRLLPVAATLAALALSAPAAAKVLDSSPSGFTIENSIVVPTDADATWWELTNGVQRWWPRDHRWWEDSTLSIDPRAGGCFCEIADSRQAQHMQVTFVDPGKTLRMTGGLGPLQGLGLHGAMEFRLAPADGGGTRVTLWYRAGGYLPANAPEGDPANLVWFAPIVDQVQAQQLGGLGDALQAPGLHSDPLPPADPAPAGDAQD